VSADSVVNNLLKMFGLAEAETSNTSDLAGEIVVLTEMLGSRFLQFVPGLSPKATEDPPLPLPEQKRKEKYLLFV